MAATVYVTRGRQRRRTLMVIVALSLAGVTSLKVADALGPAGSGGRGSGDAWASVAWPADGSAAVAVGSGRIHVSGAVQPVPIASLAKVMTALVVLRKRSITAEDPGFTVRITAG